MCWGAAEIVASAFMCPLPCRLSPVGGTRQLCVRAQRDRREPSWDAVPAPNFLAGPFGAVWIPSSRASLALGEATAARKKRSNDQTGKRSLRAQLFFRCDFCENPDKG